MEHVEELWAECSGLRGCGISSAFREGRLQVDLAPGDDFCLSYPQKQDGSEAMPEPDLDEKIDATFRNGSLTAAGIILGFSLNFISVWVSNPNDWTSIDILPMLFLTVGIAVQVKVFADLLARDSLFAAKYDRSRRLFLIGLGIVAAGMGIALINDILGLGRMRMLG
jgi:hypothetical protein